jgi:hypothetical protein
MIGLSEGGLAHGVPSNEQDIPTRYDLSLLYSQSNCLAHPAFYQVPFDRRAKPPAYGETKPTVLELIGEDRHHQQGMEPGAPFASDSPKIGVSPQAVFPSHVAAGRASPRFTQ